MTWWDLCGIAVRDVTGLSKAGWRREPVFLKHVLSLSSLHAFSEGRPCKAPWDCESGSGFKPDDVAASPEGRGQGTVSAQRSRTAVHRALCPCSWESPQEARGATHYPALPSHPKAPYNMSGPCPTPSHLLKQPLGAGRVRQRWGCCPCRAEAGQEPTQSQGKGLAPPPLFASSLE